MQNYSLDATDIRLIGHLQRNSRQSIADLAERLNLSVSACHRRLTRLQKSNIITRYQALVDPIKVGLSMTFYVDVTLQEQSVEAFERFETAVRETAEILQCHLLAGQADYLLYIAAKDAQDFSRIHQECLARLPHVANMHSNLVIREVKPFRGFRID